MSAIIGRYVWEKEMPSGAELCLECADYFDWSSSSRGAARHDVALDLRHNHMHHARRGRMLDLGGVKGSGRTVPQPRMDG